jgi:CubicO group peptidase (beta-lactamase class C family)
MRSFALALALPCLAWMAGAAEPAAAPQVPLAAALQARIDRAATLVLKDTGVPSTSIAVVKDGQIAYVRAYGLARLEPKTAATPGMRYSIGSISKQFTAAAILLLAEDGKLRLDDKVSAYLPGLTRADEISIRQLLSHTSGYQDYWPQDYVMPLMKAPVTAERILDLWARKPLDYEPGTKWQYSNTGFVVAGAIVQKVSGISPFAFLQARVFRPLGMKSAWDSDQTNLTESDAVGYVRYALGPLRPAPKEGAGWMFAAGELAMTAEDLGRWCISVLDQSVLKPDSYAEMSRETRLANGVGTRYGLGIGVASENGRRVLKHDGEVSGFTAGSAIYPEDRVAVVVLTNQDAVGAYDMLTKKIVALLFDVQDPDTPKKLSQARAILADLQRGALDRSHFTDNCNSYFDDTARKDIRQSLGGLGQPKSFVQTRQSLRGGMTARRYLVTFPKRKLSISTYEMPDGKLEQCLIAPEE